MPIDISQAIVTFVKMRAAIDEISREAKEKTAAIKKPMELIETYIRTELDKLNIDSFKGKDGCGTAFKQTKDYVSVSDKEGFKKFLAETMCLKMRPFVYKDPKGQWLRGGESDLAEHVECMLNSGAFDLITLSANKLNCKDWMQNNDGIMPPGVGYTKEIVVQIRKGTGK
jgi:hypothetical protein